MTTKNATLNYMFKNRFSYFAFFCLILGGLCLWLGQQTSAAEDTSAATRTDGKTSGPVIVLPMKGAIGPALSDYMNKGIQKAASENASLILIELDTPGGLLTTTREMTQKIIDSPVPVAVYVTPAGAHAASAGTFILYSAHIAAMAEGTNVGAATPIQMGGQLALQAGAETQKSASSEDTPASEDSPTAENKSGEKTDEEKKSDSQKLEDTLKEAIDKLANQKNEDVRNKAVEDTSAFIRGLANLRGRNAEWAEKSVTEASSITAGEALEKNVINVLANTRSDLLMQIDGMTVKMAGDTTQVIATKNVPVIEFPPDWKTKLLVMLTDPNLAMILMSIGVYGLILEFYNPGAMIPGVIGAISLTIGLYAMNILPINTAGVVLVLLGIVFMIAEFFIPSFGIMGFGGFAAFIGGITILFETESMPGLALDPGIIWGIGILGALVIGLVIWLAYTAQTEKPTVGTESMIGDEGTVIFWEGRKGKIRVQGEDWAAEATKDMDLSKGETVTVDNVKGLKVIIRAV